MRCRNLLVADVSPVLQSNGEGHWHATDCDDEASFDLLCIQHPPYCLSTKTVAPESLHNGGRHSN
ncbi:hypothetical protein AVEN_21996-1, partial [Araneus ventricosus]